MDLLQSSATALAPRNIDEFKNDNSQNIRARLAQSQCSVAQRGNGTPACAKCGRNNLGVCRDGYNVAPQTKLHLEELLQGKTEGQAVYMLSPVAKIKKICPMLSLV
ncbi:hypothetical protein H5410_046809 [Solanum commersonii]|uniref:Uncharacterized protein n=1 Tax=Solanum commersonii TaxID=4109 RepID=A0A9J5XFF9_SOLCO|nr:hypothetical protein H5410_046809 [Solanum commersonii]